MPLRRLFLRRGHGDERRGGALLDRLLGHHALAHIAPGGQLKLNLEQTNNYLVRVENWAEDALPAARDFRPDLVLLDVMMPRMFGGEIAARLRDDASLNATPIVFLTAAVSKTRVKEHDGVISGFPCLAKPASVEDVIDQIERRLGQKSPAPPAPPNHKGRVCV